MNDFKAVTGLDAGLVPTRARKNVLVVFNGDAARRDAKLSDHFADHKPRRDFTRLTIDDDSYGGAHGTGALKEPERSSSITLWC